MSRFVVYLGIFVFLATIESSVISALLVPWNVLPVLVPVSIWLYHQKGSRIGIWFLVVWGIWGDVFALSPWSSRMVIALVVISILIYASGRIFSNHSLYGLIGLGLLCSLGWVVVEALFRFVSRTELSIAFDGFLAESIFIVLALLIELVLLFQFEEHFKRMLRSNL